MKTFLPEFSSRGRRNYLTTGTQAHILTHISPSVQDEAVQGVATSSPPLHWPTSAEVHQNPSRCTLGGDSGQSQCSVSCNVELETDFNQWLT